jgi:hypothetical protein
MHPQVFKNILQVMTTLLYGGIKHNDVINVALGKIQAYKNSIRHLLEFCECIFQSKK